MEEWLDVPQLEKKTEIPATTIHRYLSKFNQFFTYKGGKRSRRYESSAIPVLLRIKDLYSKGFGSGEVEKKLLKEFPVLLNNEQAETELEKMNWPTLPSAEDMAELTKSINLILQNDQEKLELIKEQREMIKLLLQEREEEKREKEEQKQLMLKMHEVLNTKALSAPVQAQEDQQAVNKKLLEELVELKQRQQEMKEKLEEKKEAIPEQQPEPEKKKRKWLFF